MAEFEDLICNKCQKTLEIRRTDFTYLGYNFHTDVLACPVCGIVFISEDLAKGKIAEVEAQLEDK